MVAEPNAAERLQQQIDELYKRVTMLERRTQSLTLMPERRNCPHCGKLLHKPNATRCPVCNKPIP